MSFLRALTLLSTLGALSTCHRVLSLFTAPQLFSPLLPQKILADFHKFNLNPTLYPQFTNTTGTWQYFPASSWSSGFFPATFYALNERKNLCPPTPENGLGIADWLELGRSVAANLIIPEPEGSPDHDQAFLIAFLEELDINPGDVVAQDAVKDFAVVLANRFNPIVGSTRSWDGSEPYKVIIDNMMSLEVLLLAAELTGNSTLYEMAISHADTTIKNHIREDGSTWHIVEYNSKTGGVVRKRTAQGYADDSTWTRGQAWAIYGFAIMFKYTGDHKYLETARLLAVYFLKHIPEDGIIPWDFDAPLDPPRPADSAAAAIAASGLLFLARYEIDEKNADYYTTSAIQIVNNITSLAWAGPNWESILANGTLSKPAGNALTGVIYGDYYFLKIGNGLISTGLVECPCNQ